MAKLTEKSIAALVCPPGRKDRLVFDDGLPGLAIRIAPSGAKAKPAPGVSSGRATGGPSCQLPTLHSRNRPPVVRSQWPPAGLKPTRHPSPAGKSLTS